MLAHVAAPIHCLLSEYATAEKVTVRFSQDEYRGNFCPFTVIYYYITAEATALLITDIWWAASYPTSLMMLLH